MHKYPRTPHLPFSPGRTDDDEGLESFDDLISTEGRKIEVVVTEKLDGGNCCFKDGLVFARTHKAPASHESFDPIKQLFKVQVAPILGERALQRMEIFGENMVAVHSIDYTPGAPIPPATEPPRLPSPFFLLGVYDRSKEEMMSWDQLVRIANTVPCMPTPPVLFRGEITSEAMLKAIILDGMKQGSIVSPGVPAEGFVIRTTAGFKPAKFGRHVAKYVRPGHVQTDDTFKWDWKKATFDM